MKGPIPIPRERERQEAEEGLQEVEVLKKGTATEPSLLKLVFKVNKALPGPFYMYYELDNFHQNYRKYVASLSRRQLKGERLSAQELAKACYPIISPGNDRV
jgi:LEM3 (ligand-effect modulator 3) family / CDC50 family